MKALLASECRRRGDAPVPGRALKAALLAADLLSVEPGGDAGHAPMPVRRMLGGKRRRVWELPLRFLSPESLEAPSNDAPARPASPHPFPAGWSGAYVVRLDLSGRAALMSELAAGLVSIEPNPSSPDALRSVQTARRLARLADELVYAAVAYARAGDVSWSQIGDVMRVTGSAVQQRYGGGSHWEQMASGVKVGEPITADRIDRLDTWCASRSPVDEHRGARGLVTRGLPAVPAVDDE